MKNLKPYHFAWLSAHPDRTEEWLRQMLGQGFHIHHMDGDCDNHCPTNLVLIAGPDHLGLHSRLKPVRGKNFGRKRLAATEPPASAGPMSAESFCRWLSAMNLRAGDAAQTLDVNPNTISRYKKHGAPAAVALACSALYHRLEEWK